MECIWNIREKIYCWHAQRCMNLRWNFVKEIFLKLTLLAFLRGALTFFSIWNSSSSFTVRYLCPEGKKKLFSLVSCEKKKINWLSSLLPFQFTRQLSIFLFASWTIIIPTHHDKFRYLANFTKTTQFVFFSSSSRSKTNIFNFVSIMFD
jgi:hypothetical protein